jgi:hypothetical protein
MSKTVLVNVFGLGYAGEYWRMPADQVEIASIDVKNQL